MSLLNFLKSKTFLKQIALALTALLVLIFVLLQWLKVTTNHGDFETVPELKGKSIEVAKIELNQNNLVMEILDSSNYDPNYPKFSVIEQDPIAGEKVKENRKIYLTLNPSGYRNILVPDLKERTFRQAKPTLEALGFEVGKLTYIDNIAKDMVLDMRFQGEKINPGDMLPKTSKIDLVLGNGTRPISE
ncbi:MAG: PASTA domain-containing protein [Xanthomarina sp.]